MKSTPTPPYAASIKSHIFTADEIELLTMLDERWTAHCVKMEAFPRQGIQSSRDAIGAQARTGDVEAALQYARLLPFEVEFAQTRQAAELLDGKFHSDFAPYGPRLVDLAKRIVPSFTELIERHLAAVYEVTTEIRLPMRFQEDSITVWLRRQIEIIHHAVAQPITGWTTGTGLLPEVIFRSDEIE
jgi:hypothetical protein